MLVADSDTDTLDELESLALQLAGMEFDSYSPAERSVANFDALVSRCKLLVLANRIRVTEDVEVG